MDRNKTVLVISNREHQFETTATLLRHSGFKVVFDGDVNHSLITAKSKAPSLIISELAASNVDGLELCCLARNDKSLSAIPIVLVGELSKSSSIVADGLRCGAAGYYQKPFDQVKLYELCSQLADPNDTVAAVDQNENLFRSMIENISDMITIIDADGTILFESPSISRTLGYPPDELLGTSSFDLIHPDDVLWVKEYLSLKSDVLDGIVSIKYRVRTKNGSWILVESATKPIYDNRFGLAVVVTSHEVRANYASNRRHSARIDLLKETVGSNPPAEYDRHCFPPVVSWKIDTDLICEN